MREGRLIACVVLACVGCWFDEKYLRDRSEPATLAVTNATQASIELTSIYSVPEIQGAFIVDEVTLRAGATQTVRISARTYETLIAGDFVIEGRCKDGSSGWKTSGRNLEREEIRNESEWKVAITLAACPPAN